MSSQDTPPSPLNWNLKEDRIMAAVHCERGLQTLSELNVIKQPFAHLEVVQFVLLLKPLSVPQVILM